MLMERMPHFFSNFKKRIGDQLLKAFYALADDLGVRGKCNDGDE